MSRLYKYTAIDEKQIRVLSLLPAESIDAALECRLEVCSRSSPLKYEAVSYVWGTEEGPFTQLKILSENPSDGHNFTFIGPNLATALKSKS